MIPIEISLTDTFKEFRMSISQSVSLAEKVKQEVTLEIARQWDLKAKNKLRSSREEYRRSLTIVDKGRFEGAVILRGILPNMVEQGASPFDMKTGFFKSSNAKIGANGKLYFTVPFRFGTPNALGDSSIFSSIMPQEVYDEVKKRKKLSQETVPYPFNIVDSRQKVSTKNKIWEEYVHKSSIFAGMTKNSKTYQKTTQSQYGTFRRVSQSSVENMFIYSGLSARGLANEAVTSTKIPELVDKIIDDFLYNNGF